MNKEDIKNILSEHKADLPAPYHTFCVGRLNFYSLNKGISNNNIVVSDGKNKMMLRFNIINAYGLKPHEMSRYEYGLLDTVAPSEHTPKALLCIDTGDHPFIATEFIESNRQNSQLSYTSDMHAAAKSMALVHKNQDLSKADGNPFLKPIKEDIRQHLIERTEMNFNEYYKDVFEKHSSDPAVEYVFNLYKGCKTALKINPAETDGILRAVQSDAKRDNWVVSSMSGETKAYLVDWDMGLITRGINDGGELDVAAFISNHLTLGAVRNQDAYILSSATKDKFIDTYSEYAELENPDRFKANVHTIIPYLQMDYLSWYVGYRLSGEMEADMPKEKFELYSSLYDAFDDNKGGVMAFNGIDLRSMQKLKKLTIV